MRPLAEGDQALYCVLYTNAGLMRHIGPPLEAAAAQRAFHASCDHNLLGLERSTWVIVERASSRDIGLVALIREDQGAEIGAMLLPERHRLGFASEALSALVETAFAGNALPWLSARHAVGHTAMESVMRKLNFVRRLPASPHDQIVHWRRDAKN